MVFVSFAKAPGPDTCSSELRVLSQIGKAHQLIDFQQQVFKRRCWFKRQEGREIYIGGYFFEIFAAQKVQTHELHEVNFVFESRRPKHIISPFFYFEQNRFPRDGAGFGVEKSRRRRR
jgi:hypothetical protein